jgi:hypothetical protein
MLLINSNGKFIALHAKEAKLAFLTVKTMLCPAKLKAKKKLSRTTKQLL